MDRFVARQNIDHLRDALATETDESKRKLLVSLLAEQEELLAAANQKHDAQQPRRRGRTGVSRTSTGLV
jgi:hypothetical protein